MHCEASWPSVEKWKYKEPVSSAYNPKIAKMILK